MIDGKKFFAFEAVVYWLITIMSICILINIKWYINVVIACVALYIVKKLKISLRILFVGGLSIVALIIELIRENKDIISYTYFILFAIFVWVVATRMRKAKKMW